MAVGAGVASPGITGGRGARTGRGGACPPAAHRALASAGVPHSLPARQGPRAVPRGCPRPARSLWSFPRRQQRSFTNERVVQRDPNPATPGTRGVAAREWRSASLPPEPRGSGHLALAQEPRAQAARRAAGTETDRARRGRPVPGSHAPPAGALACPSRPELPLIDTHTGRR